MPSRPNPFLATCVADGLLLFRNHQLPTDSPMSEENAVGEDVWPRSHHRAFSGQNDCPLRLADPGTLPAFREHDTQSLVPSGTSPTSEIPKVGMKP